MTPTPHPDPSAPEARSEARLDAALSPPPLSPELRDRLLGLHAPVAEAAAPTESLGSVARIGFPLGRLAGGLAAAAALGVAVWFAAPAAEPDVSPERTVAATAAVEDPITLALAAFSADANTHPLAPAPGSAAARLAVLEQAAGDPWARSAWAALDDTPVRVEAPEASLF